MRKIVIIALFILCFIGVTSATEPQKDTLTKIETSILGLDYSNQKTETRLNRIEEYVYGRQKKGTNSERLKKIASDLNADLIGQENNIADSTQIQKEYTEDNSVDYPIIDDVEKNLKITSNPKQSLHSRLVTIEKQLFNNVYDTDDFYTRVERIKGKVYKNSDILARNDYDDDEYTIPEYSAEDILYDRGTDKIWEKYRPRPYGQNSKLDNLERRILSTTYPDETDNDRLARLENCLFDTEFYYDDENDRIGRIEGALKGKRTANKYDNNKLQQRLNTAMQIGAMILMVLACIL